MRAQCEFCGRDVDAQLATCTIWSRYTRRYRRVYRPSVVACAACLETYRALAEGIAVACAEGCRVGE